MFSLFDYRLRDLEKGDLALILRWRTADHVRAASFHQQVLPPEEEQIRWFEAIRTTPRSNRLIFLQRDSPCGFLVFTDLDSQHSTAHWGFYLGSTDLPKGTGTALAYHGLEYAFTILGLRKLGAEILAGNSKSIALHRKLGFVQEGLLRSQIRKNDVYEDVLIMALFADEWQQQHRRLIGMSLFSDWA